MKLLWNLTGKIFKSNSILSGPLAVTALTKAVDPEGTVRKAVLNRIASSREGTQQHAFEKGQYVSTTTRQCHISERRRAPTRNSRHIVPFREATSCHCSVPFWELTV